MIDDETTLTVSLRDGAVSIEANRVPADVDVSESHRSWKQIGLFFQPKEREVAEMDADSVSATIDLSREDAQFLIERLQEELDVMTDDE